MIRWKYVLPRALTLVVLGLAYWFGLNPLLRFSVSQVGQLLLGARVEIGACEASVAQTELRFQQVAVADPAAPLSNLFEAEQLKLSLETGPLLRKRLVIDEGLASGLRFGTPRKTSGAVTRPALKGLPPADPRLLRFVRTEAAELSQSLFTRFAALLEQELQKQVDELESPRLAKELLERWPRELEQLELRADGLKQRVTVLRRAFDSHSTSLQSDLEKIRLLSVDLESLRRDVEQLRLDLEQLRQKAEQDRQALLAAATRDAQQLQDRFKLENLNGEQLSHYLLGRELSDRLETVAHWINWGRQHLPQRAATPAEPPPAQRGVAITSFGLPAGPDCLIRKLILFGDVQNRSERFPFRAQLTGLTPRPELFDQPLVLRAEVNVPTAVRVSGVFDRRGPALHDRIIVECLGLPQPRRTLGQPEQLALLVSPGNTQLALLLDFQGDALSGQMVLRQEPVDLAPQLGPKYGGPRLAATLQGALSQIRTVEAVIDLSGTIDKPLWKFRTNLAAQLTDAVNGMVQNQIRKRRDELGAALTAQVQGDAGRIQELLLTRQQALAGKLQISQTESQQLSQLILQRAPGVEQMGRELQSRLPDLQKKLPLRF